MYNFFQCRLQQDKVCARFPGFVMLGKICETWQSALILSISLQNVILVYISLYM